MTSDPESSGSNPNPPTAAPATHAASAAQSLNVDRLIRCIRCGFDLRGHPIGANCPECGTPVAYSLAAPGSSGYAIASMVLGIISILMCFFYGLPSLVCGILAIVFYRVAKAQIVAGKASAASKSMATAGMVCGIIGLCTFVFWIGMFALMVVAGSV